MDASTNARIGVDDAVEHDPTEGSHDEGGVVEQDPIYGYQSVNVEAQRDSSSSLLNWNRNAPEEAP